MPVRSPPDPFIFFQVLETTEGFVTMLIRIFVSIVSIQSANLQFQFDTIFKPDETNEDVYNVVGSVKDKLNRSLILILTWNPNPYLVKSLFLP